MTAKQGLTLGAYTSLEYKGSGKFGKVYRAVDSRGAVRAVKIMWDSSPTELEKTIRENKLVKQFDSQFAAQFRQEAQILASLSKFSRDKLHGMYVPELYDQHLNTPGSLEYIVIDFVDAKDKPSLLDVIRGHAQEGFSPLIPETAALEMTLVFLQLLGHLHETGQHLLDAQFKNYCVELSIPDDPDEVYDRFVILDWNGTESFDKAREAGYIYPQSFDIRAATAFLFEMLTGESVVQTRKLSLESLSRYAGRHWQTISPGTRKLMAKYLNQEQGLFDVHVDAIIAEILDRLEMWRGGSDGIPSTEEAVKKAKVPADTLEDGAWFAERFEKDSKNRRRTEAFEALRAAGYMGRGIYANARGFINAQDVNRALKEYNDNYIEYELSLEDLRWHLALRLLNGQIGTSEFHDLVSDIYASLTSYPTKDYHRPETWDDYQKQLPPSDRWAAFPERDAFFGLLRDEAEIRRLWHRRIIADKQSLADLSSDLTVLSKVNADDARTDSLEVVRGFIKRYEQWRAKSPNPIYRLHTMYDLLGESWNEHDATPPDVTAPLTALQHEIEEVQTKYDRFAKTRAEFRQIGARGELSALKPFIIAERDLNFRSILEGDLAAFEAQRVIDERLKTLPEKLRSAATKEELSAILANLETPEFKDQQVVQSPADAREKLNKFSSAWQEYQVFKVPFNGTVPPRSDKAARQDANQKVGALRLQAEALSAALGSQSIRWLNSIQEEISHDWSELTVKGVWDRFKMPIITITAVVGLIIGSAVFFSVQRSQQIDAAATETAQINNTAAAALATDANIATLTREADFAARTQEANVTATQRAIAITQTTVAQATETAHNQQAMATRTAQQGLEEATETAQASQTMSARTATAEAQTTADMQTAIRRHQILDAAATVEQATNVRLTAIASTPTATYTSSNTPTYTSTPTLAPLEMTFTRESTIRTAEAATQNAIATIAAATAQAQARATEAEAAMNAALAANQCQVQSIPSQPLAGVYRQPIAARDALALLTVTARVLGRQRAEGRDWFNITGVAVPEFQIQSSTILYVEQQSVQFVDAFNCNQFFYPTATLTPSFTPVPTLTPTPTPTGTEGVVMAQLQAFNCEISPNPNDTTPITYVYLEPVENARRGTFGNNPLRVVARIISEDGAAWFVVTGREIADGNQTLRAAGDEVYVRQDQAVFTDPECDVFYSPNPESVSDTTEEAASTDEAESS